MDSKLRFKADIYVSTVYLFFTAVVLLWLTRFIFIWYNNDLCGEPAAARAFVLSLHGLRYDLCAAAYFNALFIAMRIIPAPWVYNSVYQKVSLWIYRVCTWILLAVNIGDIPYYRFTGSRLRWSNILNITTDCDIAAITAQYAGSYWWAFAAAIALALLLEWLIRRVRVERPSRPMNYGVRVAIFLLLGFGTFAAMRGRLGSGTPLSIPDAAFAVRKAPEINAVLNSPFCIIRSLNRSKSNTEAVQTFYSDSELAALRTSLHAGAGTDSLNERNFVIIIIESGGAEWIDALGNRPGKPKRGLMPFLDSIAGQSTVVEHVIACSRSSCGGATAILAGIPAFDPFYFMLSPYNKNILDTPARLLGERGYDTAFYYGCKHGSFNIDQTAFAAGYTRITDRDKYGNDDDYDGMWGIFDYPMAGYVARDLSNLSQPFIAAWFTISAHGPFTLPEGFDTSRFIHPEASPERGLEYTDVALRHFFTTAATQPWYRNTTFIITADHGNRDFKGTVYDNDYIRNHIPLIIYTPDGSAVPRRVADRVASQHDIAPTLLSLAGYDSPYIAVGSDILADTFDGYGIARTDGGRYIVTGPRYTIYTSASLDSVEEVYDTALDPSMADDATDYDAAAVDAMLTWAKAFIQDYTTRLNNDRLSIENE